MKTPLLLATLLLATLAPAALADDGVTVRLLVNAGAPPLPAWRDCDVHVPAGADGGALLDQAVADGCILEWSAAEFPGFGRYVSSIDHVTEALATFWALRVDGTLTDYGIDLYQATQGHVVQFTYEEWPVPLGL